MGDILHENNIAVPPTAVYTALIEQNYPKSSLHAVFSSQRTTESTS